MCGTVGYRSQRKTYPMLIKGLKRLEYRGYDRAALNFLEQWSALPR